MFTQDVLQLNCETAIVKITNVLKTTIFQTFRRKGAVVAISGGIDSSVCAAICARVLGSHRVLGLILPEADSSPDSEKLARILVEHLGIECHTYNIAPVLEAIGCYQWRDQAIQSIFPEYKSGWKSKITISENLLNSDRLNFFNLVLQSPEGKTSKMRLPLSAYLQIVAATNFKQRIRKTIEFFHADRLNYVVIGTPNRLEYDQGFFVKNGDGSADIKPIAHLYKTQVYQLARYLELPAEIINQKPTTDTYSLPQGQDEFYFVLPYDKMDLALFAFNHEVPAENAAPVLGLTPQQVERVYRDIQRKRQTTQYLHTPPILVESVNEINKAD